MCCHPTPGRSGFSTVKLGGPTWNCCTCKPLAVDTHVRLTQCEQQGLRRCYDRVIAFIRRGCQPGYLACMLVLANAAHCLSVKTRAAYATHTMV